MKYGLKASLRAPVKTVLFVLLIAAVSAFLSLGAGMLQSAERMLDEADTVFKTAGEFTYAEDSFNRSSFNLEDYAFDGAKTLEDAVSTRGYTEGAEPFRGEMPYADYAVFTVKYIRDDTRDSAVVCRVERIHYQHSELRKPGETVVMLRDEMTDVDLKQNGTYIVYGEISRLGGSRNIMLTPRGFAGVAPVIDVTDCDPDEFWRDDSGKYFLNAIDELKIENKMLDLVASWDISALSAFHSGDCALSEGAFPTDHTVNACLLPERIAAQLGLASGDTLTVNIRKSVSEIFNVAGVYRSDANNTVIYILDSGQPWLVPDGTDRTLARAVVENRDAAKYLEAVQNILPEDVSFEMFDQGYETATHAIFGMRETVMLITVLASLLGLAVLVFFAYIFVYREGESILVLLRLGAGAGRALAFLLTGAGVKVVLAAAAGCVCGFFVSGYIADEVYAASGMTDIYDYRFSVLSLGARLETFAPSPRVDWVMYAVIFFAVTALALLLCLMFGLYVIRRQNALARYRRAEKKVSYKAKTSFGVYDSVPGIHFRYALRSILRGGARSFAVPVLFAVLLLFVSVFRDFRSGYGESLENVYGDVPVSLRFTDLKTASDGLNIPDEHFAELEDSGFVEDMWYADNFRYMYLGVSEYADGGRPGVPPMEYRIPTGSFVRETFENQMMSLTAPLMTVKNIMAQPQFSRSPASSVQWADGMSAQRFESFGVEWEDVRIPCLVSQEFMTEYGLALNDVFRAAYFFANPFRSGIVEKLDRECKVAGVFSADMNRYTAVIPDAANITRFITDWDGKTELTYSAGGFTVKNPERLSAFKDWLEERYDPVGKPGRFRRWLIIDDRALYGTVESLTKYLGYMDMLYPVMMLAVAAIGFIVSSLLLKSRGMEISALRSLGARMPQVFAAFFLEPVILSLPGTALGIGFTVAVLQASPLTAFAGVPVSAACFFLGSAVAAVHSYRKAVLVSFYAEE